MSSIKLHTFRLVYVTCMTLAIVSFMMIFLWIVGDILRHALPHFSMDFIWTAPSQAGRSGGIRPVILSTLYILGLCMGLTLPIAVLAGLFFSERLAPIPKFLKPFKAMVDILAGVPSVVFGLFGNTYFTVYLGLGYSILAGALTLACMILPLAIKIIESSFRSVPEGYIKGSQALGLSQWTCFLKIMVPAISPQIAGAFILSLSRALAETAALLFTSGYVLRDPRSLLDSGRTLSIHIYDLSMNVTGGNISAYKSALVLLTMIGSINLLFHFIIHHWSRYQYGK